MIEPLLAGAPDSGKKKKIFFSVFAAILLIAAVIGIVVGVVGVNSKTTHTHTQPPTVKIRASEAHAIVKSSCSVTLYPDLCYSTLSGIPDLTEKVKTSKDVIELTLNKTKERIQRNHFIIKKLAAMNNVEKHGALHVCLEMVASTLEDLDEVVGFLKIYAMSKGNRRHVDDIIIYMSATITNQETCIDEFANGKHSRHLQDSLIDMVINARNMCSNTLALIKNMTDADMAKTDQVKRNTWMLMNEDGENWPKWLSAEDRRLLLSETVTPNVVVDANGGGDYNDVSAAVADAPPNSETRYVIKIVAGIYREQVDIPSNKWNLMFLGEGQSTTFITAKHRYDEHNSTYDTATVGVKGKGFLARDITFENNAGIEANQAVALRVESDKSAFYRCGMIARQDTLYVFSKRQFYVNCYIAGTVDFIFGDAAVVLQDCDIRSHTPGPEQRCMVTAQGRSDPNQDTGIVIQKSTIDATKDSKPVQFETYLGRPWKNFSRTVVMQSQISDVVNPAGWYYWEGAEEERYTTLYYAEYENTGAGADTSQRVDWPGYKVITDAAEAERFTVENFIRGGDWLPDTGFPFSTGL